MKKVSISMTALVALAFGLAVGAQFITVESNIQPSAQQDSPAKEVIKDPCKEYVEDGAFRAKLNGQKLNLDHKPWLESEYADSNVTALSTGQMLVSVGSSLYLLDSKKDVQWKFTAPQQVFDYAAIESTGLIYVTAGDNTMFILELTSGKRLFRDGRNGSAAYGQVEAFGEDQCLVLDNYWGYRMKRSESELNDPSWWTPKLMGDGVTAWRGTKKLWHRDFPPDADLLVKGNKIYAVTKTRTSIYIREITIPEK